MSVDHSGHRQRLKNALEEQGILAFSPHEVTELMLYAAFPMGDVNELAHRLCDVLGGAVGTINASFDALSGLEGVTERAAGIINAFGKCVRAYETSGEEPVFVRTLGDSDQITEVLKKFRSGGAALLSSGKEVIFISALPEENPVKYLCEKLIKYDAHFIIIVKGSANIDGVIEKTRIFGAETTIIE